MRRIPHDAGTENLLAGIAKSLQKRDAGLGLVAVLLAWLVVLASANLLLVLLP